MTEIQVPGKKRMPVGDYLRGNSLEKGLLFTTEDRGTYVVNPWMVAKGRWERIRELQANFEYDGQKWLWLRKLTETKEEPVTEEETA